MGIPKIGGSKKKGFWKEVAELVEKYNLTLKIEKDKVIIEGIENVKQ